MKFIIGSASSRKIDVSGKIIRELFCTEKDIEIIGYGSVSGVPNTPYDKQTFDGARNRALDAKAHVSGGSYYIGLESGLVERYGHIYEEAWTAVITSDNREFFGYSSGLKVPDYVLQKMNDLKMEHCDVMTVLEDEHDISGKDTWGSYSGGMLLREVSLEESLRNALIQIISPENSFYKQ
jgi:non-canonical (house-cleaning) NTP pyrophosphatase